MPSTKVIKPKPVEPSSRTVEERTGPPVKLRTVTAAQSEPRAAPGAAAAVRKSRASSCPRRDRWDRWDRGDRCDRGDRGDRWDRWDRGDRWDRCDRGDRRDRWDRCAGAQRPARSSSSAPKATANCPGANPDHRRGKPAAVQPKCRDVTAGPGQRDQRGAESRPAGQSNKAFTVIPPNPKKRREIQRKAEAELAALEELRLSKAMTYVCIDPSRVGGCMSLEEVRLKQQQEMMQAKRKQKPMKKQLMEQTAVLKC